MSVAIIYTSKHGTTKEVVKLIAERLRGQQITLIDLKQDKSPNIELFDQVILGTPIYVGKPSKEVKMFCEKHASALTSKPLALFVCGMYPGEAKQVEEITTAYPETLRQHAKAVAFLGGAFLFERMSFIERIIIKRVAQIDRSIKQINVSGIDAFVNQIAKSKQPEVLRAI